jgi:glycine cleavage system regulatory protein
MNQRPAKTYRAAMQTEGNVNISRLKQFSEEAARLLQSEGQEDAAFYFEQLAEYIQHHPEKGLSEPTARILGI